MNINEAFPSNYIKASELRGDATVTIANVTMEDMGGGDMKPVIYFRGHEKGLVLNKTNANTIAGLHTPMTEHWIGKQITLFPTQVDYQGRQVEAIRVRMRVPDTGNGGGFGNGGNGGSFGHATASAPPPPPPTNPAGPDDDVPF